MITRPSQLPTLRLCMALLISLLACPNTSRAQPRVERVVTTSTDARDVARIGDRIYVATDGGLLVLEAGRLLRRYGPADGLPGARLRSVSVVDGELWIGGVEGTVRARITATGLTISGRFPVRRVRRVVRFGDTIWLASYGEGLHRLRGSTLVPVRLGSAHAYQRLTDLLVHQDHLLVATQGVGILRLDTTGRIQSRVRERDGLASQFVWRFLEVEGQVVVTTINGLSLLTNSGINQDHVWTQSVQRLPVRDVRSALVTEHALWLGTFGRGLYRVALDGSRASPVTGVGPVHALIEDGSRVLVAHERGLGQIDETIDRGTIRATSIALGGIETSDLTALAHAFGTLWVGTFGRGLARMEGESLVAVSTDRWAMDQRINDLAVSGTGATERLWIATDRGLWWHDGRVFSRVEDPVGPSWIHTTSLNVDPNGAVWVTTGRELCRCLGDQWRCWTGDATFPVAQLHAVTTDAQGRVWVGGLHGLYEFNPSTERFVRHSVSTGELPVDWVTALIPWDHGVMAGTYHGGVSIETGGRFTQVTESQGALPSNWVNPHAMRQVGSDVWIGTLERGLVIGRPGAWQRFTTREGLPSDDVTDILSDATGVWVATRGGLVHFTR